jgi:hypothetical protein
LLQDRKREVVGKQEKIELGKRHYRLLGFTCHTLAIGFLYIRTLQHGPFTQKLFALGRVFYSFARPYEQRKYLNL